MQTLRLIGYWLGPDAPGWPDVRSFVDPDPDPAERDRVLGFLGGGTVWVAAGGFSECRFCGALNGSAELTDGTDFVWPEGLAHYVAEHNVRLPAEVTAKMQGVPAPLDEHTISHRLFETQDLTIDRDWWRSHG